MKFGEKLMSEVPLSVGAGYYGGYAGCPYMYGYEDESEKPCGGEDAVTCEMTCRECWEREIPGEKEK